MLGAGWAAVRARPGIMIAGPVLAALAVLVLNVTGPHQARAVVAFPSPDRTGALAGLGVPGEPSPPASQLLSQQILNRMVVERLDGGPETVDSLREKLSVDAGPSPETATLVASAPSDQEAVTLAQGWTQSVQRTRNDVLYGQFRAVRETLRELRRDRSRGTLTRREIDRRLGQLLAAQRSVPRPTTVVQAATAIPSVSIRNELLGLVAGALLAAAICVLLELRDPRLRSRSAAEAGFGHPVLTALTPRPAPGDDAGHAASPEQDEAAEVLAVKALSLLGSANGGEPRADGPEGTLVVTSTAGVPDLAGTAAAVVAALARRAPAPGVVAWRTPDLADRLEAEQAGYAALRRLDGSAAELADEVASLRDRAPLVIVLVPPLGSVPSALLADRIAGAWLVLAALDHTRLDEAQDVRAELESVGERSVAVVLASEPSRQDNG